MAGGAAGLPDRKDAQVIGWYRSKGTRRISDLRGREIGEEGVRRIRFF